MGKPRTIQDYIDSIDKVLSLIPKEEERIVIRNKERILDLNRYDQLYDQGIDIEGRLLKPYAPATIAYKIKKGQPFGHRTLYDEGDFTSVFDLLFRQRRITIFSRDPKTQYILARERRNIFGLTDYNIRVYDTQIIKPELDAFLKKYL